MPMVAIDQSATTRSLSFSLLIGLPFLPFFSLEAICANGGLFIWCKMRIFEMLRMDVSMRGVDKATIV